MAEEDPIGRVVHILYSGLGGHGAVIFGRLGARPFADAGHVVLSTGVEPPPEGDVARLERRGMAWRHLPRQPGRKYVAYCRSLHRAIFADDLDPVSVQGHATTHPVVWTRSRAQALRLCDARLTARPHEERGTDFHRARAGL